MHVDLGVGYQGLGSRACAFRSHGLAVACIVVNWGGYIARLSANVSNSANSCAGSQFPGPSPSKKETHIAVQLWRRISSLRAIVQSVRRNPKHLSGPSPVPGRFRCFQILRWAALKHDLKHIEDEKNSHYDYPQARASLHVQAISLP